MNAWYAARLTNLAWAAVGMLLLAAASLRAQSAYDTDRSEGGRAPTPSGNWRYDPPADGWEDDQRSPCREVIDQSRPTRYQDDYDPEARVQHAEYRRERDLRQPRPPRDRYGNIERTQYEWRATREQAKRARLPEAPAFRPGADERVDVAVLPKTDYLDGDAGQVPQRNGYRTAAGRQQYPLPPQPEILAPQSNYAPNTPNGAVMYEGGPMPQDGYGADGYGADGYGYGDDGYGPRGCDTCGNGMYHTPCPDCGRCCGGYSCPHRWLEESSVFVGVHAFKGGLDQGQNGNFGFQEGVNFAGSLWHQHSIGYQVGAQFLQSDLSGTNIANAFNNSRQQTFLTVGLFHRPLYGAGLQGGAVFDWLDDNFYTTTRFSQMRVEISYISMFGNEFGFWSVFSTGSTQSVQVNQNTLMFGSTDMFNFFYRKTFSTGDQARVWGGFTDSSSGIFGADYRVHMSNQWDLVGGFNYLIPSSGKDSGGSSQESWGLAMNVVWYPTRPACGLHNGPFRQLFGVADNNTFMIRNK